MINAFYRGAGDAAIATNIGRGVGVLFQLWLFFNGGKHIRLLGEHLRVNAEALKNIFKTSIGGIGQMIVAMIACIFLMRILADVSSEAVSGATITIRIMMFTMMPAFGLANAAATLVGQNLGAEKPDRAESSVWKIGVYNMIFLVGVSLIYFFFNEDLMRIFSDNPDVIAIGGEWIQILSYSYFVYGWWMVFTSAFNGAGGSGMPTKINPVFF